MKYFTKLKLSGYKSIKDVSFTLQPGVNIFIGPNGSGKSNLLEFVYALRDGIPKFEESHSIEIEFSSNGQIVKKEIKRDSTNPNLAFDWIGSLGGSLVDGLALGGAQSSNNIYFIKICLGDETLMQEQFPYELTAREFNNKLAEKYPNSPELLNKLSLEITFFKFGTKSSDGTFLSAPFDFSPDKLEPFYHKRSKIIFAQYVGFAYSVSSVKVSKIDENDKKVSEFLGNYLRYFKKEIKAFLDIVKEYSPIEDFQHKSILLPVPVEKGIKLENIQFQFLIEGSWYNWSDLSDGTKRIFEILYCTYHAKEVVLIEEPELGIHPHQLNKLCQFLKEQAEEKQILISTHAPEVLDKLASKDLKNINIVSIHKGATRIRKLTAKKRNSVKYYLEEELFLSDYWKYSDLEK